MRFTADMPMAPKTTLQIGGQARLWVDVRDARQIDAALEKAAELQLPVLVMGGGSNVVVSDGRLNALVIHPVADAITVQDVAPTQALVTAGAGRSWDSLVKWAVERDLAGVTCLSGIPGSVGAAPMQNIGAYGQELSEVFESCEVFDLLHRRVETWDAARCEFSYRDSALKRARGRFVVMGVTLRLTRSGRPTLRYGELSRAVESMGDLNPSLAAVRQHVLTIRRRKGMVVDADDAASRSAGSYFINPTVAAEVADEVEARLGSERGSMPRYLGVGGQVKMSAAWLIERSGLRRGYTHAVFGRGRVGLSPKHTLALVNLGDATADDLHAFAGHVQDVVKRACGVSLHPEPVRFEVAAAFHRE